MEVGRRGVGSELKDRLVLEITRTSAQSQRKEVLEPFLSRLYGNVKAGWVINYWLLEG